ncbi:MAG: hypothetical protein QXU87_09380 [Candidatus Caldarchaeum sp.]
MNDQEKSRQRFLDKAKTFISNPKVQLVLTVGVSAAAGFIAGRMYESRKRKKEEYQ